MKLIIILGVILVLAIIAFFISFSSKPETTSNTFAAPTSQQEEKSQAKTTDTHIKASFSIFTNGTFRIFTDSKYHNQSFDVYIEPPNVNIVNVKKKGITWSDFFKTLPMELTKDCLTTGTRQAFCTEGNATLKFYLNEIKDPNVLDRIINHGDQLLISFGVENDEQIENQLKQIPEIR